MSTYVDQKHCWALCVQSLFKLHNNSLLEVQEIMLYLLIDGIFALITNSILYYNCSYFFLPH